ncbi:hypothetical protein GCM10009864_49560 [Streptomyces lunalinharesii]|uniref:Uncharacterized protein n=1 Tax=Streptomyces lunalinharesii TaxID=333384 RepID=A0ABN3SBW3_9ACTN
MAHCGGSPGLVALPTSVTCGCRPSGPDCGWVLVAWLSPCMALVPFGAMNGFWVARPGTGRGTTGAPVDPGVRPAAEASGASGRGAAWLGVMPVRRRAEAAARAAVAVRAVPRRLLADGRRGCRIRCFLFSGMRVASGFGAGSGGSRRAELRRVT